MLFSKPHPGAREHQRKGQWSHFCMINALTHRHRDPHHRQRKEQWSHFCMNNALAHQRLDVHTVVALSESELRCNRAPTVLLSERLGTQDQIPYSVEQPTAKARSPALFQATPWCRDRRIVMLWPPNSKTTPTKTHTLVTVTEAMTPTQSRQTNDQAHCLIHLQHRRRCPAKDPSTTLQAQVFLHQYHAIANKVTMSAIGSMNTNYVHNGSAASPVHPLPDHRRKEQWSHFLHALLQVTPWRGCKRIVMLCIFLITHPAFLTLQ